MPRRYLDDDDQERPGGDPLFRTFTPGVGSEEPDPGAGQDPLFSAFPAVEPETVEGGMLPEVGARPPPGRERPSSPRAEPDLEAPSRPPGFLPPELARAAMHGGLEEEEVDPSRRPGLRSELFRAVGAAGSRMIGSQIGGPAGAAVADVGAAGGLDPVLEAAKRVMGHDDPEFRSPTAHVPPGERFAHAANRFTQGLAGVPVGALEGISILAHELDRLPFTGETEVMDLPTWQWAQNVRAFAAGIFPESEEMQESFWNDAVPAALGSFAGFIGTGAGAGAVAGRAGAIASSSSLAGLSGASQAYGEALALGANTRDAQVAARLGIIPGLVQVFPVIRAIDRLAGRMPPVHRNRLINSLAQGAMGSVEEGLVEGIGAVGFGAIAEHVTGVEQDLLARAWESAGPAGVAGFMVNMLTGLRMGSVAHTRQLPQTDPRRRAVDALQGAEAASGRVAATEGPAQPVDGEEGVSADPDEAGAGLGVRYDPETGEVFPGLEGEAEAVRPDEGEVPLRSDHEGNPVTPIVLTGRETEIVLADGRRLPARYALVDAREALISHDPVSFLENPEFPPGIQDRRYHADLAARDEVVDRAARIDPGILLDPTQRATDGPSIIRQDGVTLSGNQRHMILDRAAELHPERFAVYVEALLARAGEFGLDAAETSAQVQAILERGGVPAVDRVLLGDPPTSRSELGELMAAFNQTATKARDALGEAQVQARRLRAAPRALAHFTETVQGDQTIRAYLDTAAGAEFVQALVQEGVIPRQEAGRYLSRTGTVNAEGRNAIERMMLSAAVQDAEIIDRAPASWLQRVERAVPALLEAQSVEGWDLTPALREALELGAAMRESGHRSVDALVSQTDLTGRQFSPEGEALARFIEESGPVQVAETLRRYAAEAQAAERQLESEDLFDFTPTQPAEVFAELFGAPDAPAGAGRITGEAALEVEGLARTQHAGMSPAELDAAAQELLREIEGDPAVQEARERPQPGDPRTTLARFPIGHAERDAYRAERTDQLDEANGFRSVRRMLNELGIDSPYTVARDRIATLILGPPASGKSTLANPVIRETQARLIDSDEAKAILDEFEGGRNAGGEHEESGVIRNSLLERALTRGENIVYPTVGHDLGAALATIQRLHELGYEVHVLLNEVPAVEAARRALQRFRDSGRWVELSYILEDVGNRPSENWPQVRQHTGVTSAQRWSNDVPRGEAPVLLDETGTPHSALSAARDPRAGEARAGGSRGRPGSGNDGRDEQDPGRARRQDRVAPPPSGRPDDPGAVATLEVQDDLFGAPPQLRGEQQRSLFGETQQTLGEAEAQARRTIEQLAPVVQAGRASNAQLDAYQEALGLLRREELLSGEELGARARRIEREVRRIQDARQREFFELRPTERKASREDLTTLAPWESSLEAFAGEEPGPGDGAAVREFRRRERIWTEATLEAVAEGELTPDEARERGLTWLDESTAPLPTDEPLYHVTTARTGVLGAGLQTRAQLGLDRGNGLGGADQTTVSLTTSEDVARQIRDTLLLARSVARGDVTVEQLAAEAEAGTLAEQPWDEPLMRSFDSGWSRGDGVPAEAARNPMEFLSRWILFRDQWGSGPTAAFFPGLDAAQLGNLHPSEISILELRPRPGAHGFRSEGHWKTHSGRAVDVVHVDGRDPSEFTAESPLDRGWAKNKIRTALEQETGEVLALQPRASDVLPGVRELAREGPEGRPAALSEIRADMEKVLGIPIRTGRLRRLAQAFGLYQVQPEVIRTRMANDITVIAHEVGHHMHKLLFTRSSADFNPRDRTAGINEAQLQPWRSELEELAGELKGPKLAEGWAEYWRQWITNRTHAERRAPTLSRWLEGRLRETEPALWDAVQRWQTMYEGYAAAAPWARVGSRISYSEGRWAKVWKGAQRGFDRAYQEVMDRFSPLERAQRELEGLKPGDPIDKMVENIENIPKVMADLIAGAGGMADHFMRRAPVDGKTGRPRDDVKSLHGALAPVRDNLEKFEIYVTAKRTLHLQTEREIDQGFETQDLQDTLAHFEQTNPEFIEAAQDLHDYQEALLDYMVDGGVITRATADSFREGNPFYVPLYKVRDPVMHGEHGTGTGGNDHLFDPFKRIGNSSRDVVSPIESIIKNTHFYTQLVQKQKVQAALANLAEIHGAGKWITPIEAPLQLAAAVPKGEITDWMRREVAKELGHEALDPQFMRQIGHLLPELFLVMRPGDFFGKENVISHVQKSRDAKTGEEKLERHWYEVEPTIYRALTHTPDAGRSGLVRLLTFPAQALRVGATTALEFIGRNPFRDQTVAFVQSAHGYTPGVDLARGVFHLLGKTDMYWQWKRSGGEFAALVDMDRKGVVDSIRRMHANPLANVVKHPFGALQALAATMENATRLGEYLNAMRAGGERKGVIKRWIDELDPEFRQEAGERMRNPPEGLTSYAAWHSREIGTQYSTHGASDSIQIARQLSTFWNARIQSYQRLYRAFHEDPVGASLRSLVSITLPALALYAINREDDEYWEIPGWQRDWFFIVKVPNVSRGVVPDFLQQQGGESFGGQVVRPFVNTGETVWLRFPIPWELGLFFKTLPERLLEWWDTEDPEGLTESLKSSFWTQVTGTVLPIPTAVEPLIENLANWSFFMNRNIDPVFEEGDARFIQRPGTSELARGTADMLHRMGATKVPGVEKLVGSPQKLENMMWSYSGGLGRMMVDIADEAGKRAGIFERRESRPATMADVPGVRGFVAREPGLNSESVQRFRRRWQSVRRTKATIDLLEREERFEQVEAELADPRVQELYDLYSEYNRVNTQLSGLYAQASIIERDPDLTEAEKIEQIRDLGREATAIARETIERELPGDRPFFRGRGER